MAPSFVGGKRRREWDLNPCIPEGKPALKAGALTGLRYLGPINPLEQFINNRLERVLAGKQMAKTEIGEEKSRSLVQEGEDAEDEEGEFEEEEEEETETPKKSPAAGGEEEGANGGGEGENEVAEGEEEAVLLPDVKKKEEQVQKPARKMQVDCMGCGDAIDVTGKIDGEKINCPYCKAEFVVVDFGDGDVDIDFVT
jgi:hypothetical protein